MFMWHYFVMYFGCGLLIGFTVPKDENEPLKRFSGKVFFIAVLLLIGLLIWNFATFGIAWAIISFIEAFAGMAIAMMVTGRIKSE